MSKLNVKNLSVRFIGDSGDGIQLIGDQFVSSSVKSGNNFFTFVEFPAEIRAPVGSLFGISVFQVCISSNKIYYVGDKVDILVVMNPAALAKGLTYLKSYGIIIIDIDTFKPANLKLAGFSFDPLENDYLLSYKVIKVPITSLTVNCVGDILQSLSKSKKCRNFFTLGIIYWLCSKSCDLTLSWMDYKFKKSKDFLLANKKALLAGYNYGETLEFLHEQVYVEPNLLDNKSFEFRKISGNDAFVLGAVCSSLVTNIPVFSANYPITPASDIFQKLIDYNSDTFKVIQLEDEISSIMAVIGASYGGSLSFTCTSGPGLDLMQEGLGLAVMSELPILLLDIQRSGPSTGMPTKSEQADLFSSVFGRHGECQVIVLSPNSPGDCFYTIIEGFYLACKYAVPVIILSDANLANSSELWKLPSESDVSSILFKNGYFFQNRLLSFKNNDYRKWINPVSSEVNWIGGLERNFLTGDICYDPINHFDMVKLRYNKILKSAEDFNKTVIFGNQCGKVLLIVWGSVFGLVKSIYDDVISDGVDLSFICLRYLNPLPNDLCIIINNFEKILVIEENMGQLALLLKAKYLINVISICQVTGKPFDYIVLKNDILKNI